MPLVLLLSLLSVESKSAPDVTDRMNPPDLSPCVHYRPRIQHLTRMINQTSVKGEIRRAIKDIEKITRVAGSQCTAEAIPTLLRARYIPDDEARIIVDPAASALCTIGEDLHVVDGYLATFRRAPNVYDESLDHALDVVFEHRRRLSEKQLDHLYRDLPGPLHRLSNLSQQCLAELFYEVGASDQRTGDRPKMVPLLERLKTQELASHVLIVWSVESPGGIGRAPNYPVCEEMLRDARRERHRNCQRRNGLQVGTQ
jgi:hypothetical protein